jgi:hypothetical protein
MKPHGCQDLPDRADVPDGERRDAFPEPVIRRKHPVITMPVLPRRRDEIGEPVQKLKRRELDDAVGPGRVDLRPGPILILSDQVHFASTQANSRSSVSGTTAKPSG